ncbi:MAG: hypothetical protein JXR15_02280 [Shimia sp.]|uniref:hypothetical protein n=1 Tax=Shimia sp. TaxID=1954381 RepID=UPI003B8D31EE
MAKIFADLLALDGMAQTAGCGLKLELRKALEASLRFPAKAASPAPVAEDMTGEMPENVIRFGEHDGVYNRRNEA